MKSCTYFVEGQCEEKLLNAIKESPSIIRPGKVKVLNVIQNRLRPSHLISIKDGLIVFVFDSDVSETGNLIQNIEMVKRICPAKTVQLVFLVQVMNLEDELVRATDVRRIADITGSKSKKDFKSDFLAIKDCRSVMEKHGFDIGKMWRKKPPRPFDFIPQGAGYVVS